MLSDVEHQKALGSNPSDYMAVLAGIFAPPLLFNRGTQAPQQQRRIPSVLRARITHPARTWVREWRGRQAP
jgi:hypothetical protein